MGSARYSGTMACGVLLSIDTELTWRAHLSGASWAENHARSIEPAGVGLGYQLAAFARAGLKACFFVDPMPTALFGIDPIRRIVACILEGGQEVQLHIHPVWLEADRRGPPPDRRRFELSSYDEVRQLAVIEQAREWLTAAGAPPPIAFRAGSFGADPATLRAVARAGLRYDSSHNGGLQPWPCETGLPMRAVAPFAVDRLIELPVGLVDEGGGRLRHLQIGAVSAAEIRAALLHAEAEGSPLVTLLGHSFELAARDGRRPNRFVRRRFDTLCDWLGRHVDRFPTRHIADLAALPLGHPATPAPAHRRRRLARMIEQAAANLLVERRL